MELGALIRLSTDGVIEYGTEVLGLENKAVDL